MKKILLIILLALSLLQNVSAAKAIKSQTGIKNFKEGVISSLDCGEQLSFKTEVVNTNELDFENQLPIQAKRSFAKMFEGYKIKHAFHFTGNEGEGFYISAENEKESIVVKIDRDLEISIYKQIKK